MTYLTHHVIEAPEARSEGSQVQATAGRAAPGSSDQHLARPEGAPRIRRAPPVRESQKCDLFQGLRASRLPLATFVLRLRRPDPLMRQVCRCPFKAGYGTN